MKSLLIIASLALFPAAGCQSQIKNAQVETVKIYGNCEMCEKTIEDAGTKKKEYKTDWNVDTKVATITFDKTKTTLDAVLKSIALSGYDNEKYLAPDEAYSKLHECCQYERTGKQKTLTPQSETAISSTNHSEHTQASASEKPQEKDELEIIFDSYFSLKDALVKTNGKEASASAQKLASAISAVQMESLTQQEHDVWMKVTGDLSQDAEKITKTSDIETQRKHFTTLSERMYELVKVSRHNETIYYQNCPMYNDGSGAKWLSRDKEIKNPYYGSEMLTCGKTIETIE